MTGVNANTERQGHTYDMGDAANKAAARSSAGTFQFQFQFQSKVQFTFPIFDNNHLLNSMTLTRDRGRIRLKAQGSRLTTDTDIVQVDLVNLKKSSVRCCCSVVKPGDI